MEDVPFVEQAQITNTSRRGGLHCSPTFVARTPPLGRNLRKVGAGILETRRRTQPPMYPPQLFALVLNYNLCTYLLFKHAHTRLPVTVDEQDDAARPSSGFAEYTNDEGTYRGEWREGLPHGTGVGVCVCVRIPNTYICSNLYTYTGTFFYSTGVRYSGKWREGRPFGEGSWTREKPPDKPPPRPKESICKCVHVRVCSGICKRTSGRERDSCISVCIFPCEQIRGCMQSQCITSCASTHCFPELTIQPSTIGSLAVLAKTLRLK